MRLPASYSTCVTRKPTNIRGTALAVCRCYPIWIAIRSRNRSAGLGELYYQRSSITCTRVQLKVFYVKQDTCNCAVYSSVSLRLSQFDSIQSDKAEGHASLLCHLINTQSALSQSSHYPLLAGIPVSKNFQEIAQCANGQSLTFPASDSSVGTATRYKRAGPRIESQWPSGLRWVCSWLLAGVAGSIPAGGINVCVVCVIQ